MNIPSIPYQNQDLLDYVGFLRYNAEVEYYEAKKREEEVYKEDTPTLEGVSTNVERFFKRTFRDTENKLSKAKKALERYLAEHPSLLSVKRAEDTRNVLFFADKKGEARFLFALSSYFDKKIDCPHIEEGFAAVSAFLYGKAFILPKLILSFKGHYEALSPDLDREEKKAAALFAAGALGVMTLPIAMGATAALTPFHLVLGSLGLSAEAAGFALSLSTLVYGYGRLGEIKEEKAMLRELGPDEFGYLLASTLTLIEHYKATLKPEEFKMELDRILQELATYKSDLDYYAFVEGDTKKGNVQKIKAFHVFDDRLLHVVGIKA